MLDELQCNRTVNLIASIWGSLMDLRRDFLSVIKFGSRPKICTYTQTAYSANENKYQTQMPPQVPTSHYFTSTTRWLGIASLPRFPLCDLCHLPIDLTGNR
jgi:hypothetical protein